MPGFLQVNWARVCHALCWLKSNNPIYHDVVILEAQLADLPEDRVPQEIWSLMKHSDDGVLLEEERDSYILEDLRTMTVCVLSSISFPTLTSPIFKELLLVHRVFWISTKLIITVLVRTQMKVLLHVVPRYHLLNVHGSDASSNDALEIGASQHEKQMTKRHTDCHHSRDPPERSHLFLLPKGLHHWNASSVTRSPEGSHLPASQPNVSLR